MDKMKNIGIKVLLSASFSLAMLCGANVSAQTPQEKGLASINEASAKSVIGFLASDYLEGREAGRDGSYVSSEYVASMLEWIGVRPLGDSYFEPFDAYAKERQKRGRFEIHPDSIAALKKGVHRKLSMRNVLGMIPGRKSDEYVIVGAHIDHVGFDPALEGDKIYNGADDNASGVAAVIQIARAFVESGVQPERNVIFAFWDGEEIGLLGSRYFAMNFPHISQVKGYLNFDMIGRNNNPAKPRHVVYFHSATAPVFGEWMRRDMVRYGIDLEPNIVSMENAAVGSDNASFARLGIPIIWYHTDGHPDYHMPSDHADKINYPKVVEITKAAFLNMWNLANEKKY